MKHTAIALALSLIASAPVALAAESGAFGTGGPQSYIWAELGMKRMKMAMETADKNSDGMIDKDEYMAFAEMNAGKDYMMMDMNNDGMISADEWTTTLHPGSSFYGSFR